MKIIKLRYKYIIIYPTIFNNKYMILWFSMILQQFSTINTWFYYFLSNFYDFPWFSNNFQQQVHDSTIFHLISTIFHDSSTIFNNKYMILRFSIYFLWFSRKSFNFCLNFYKPLKFPNNIQIFSTIFYNCI